jgi:hypothetical protein
VTKQFARGCGTRPHDCAVATMSAGVAGVLIAGGSAITYLCWRATSDKIDCIKGGGLMVSAGLSMGEVATWKYYDVYRSGRKRRG